MVRDRQSQVAEPRIRADAALEEAEHYSEKGGQVEGSDRTVRPSAPGAPRGAGIAPEELDALVRAHAPILWRGARAAGLSPEDADDVVQETMLVLVRRAADYDGRASVRTWLWGIMLNKIREHRRSASTDESLEGAESGLETRFTPEGTWLRPPRRPDQEAAAGQTMEWVRQCLKGLPERHRLAFLLREGEGASTEELCKVLHVSPNNLGVILFRARAAMRECLETKGVKGSADVALQ